LGFNGTFSTVRLYRALQKRKRKYDDARTLFYDYSCERVLNSLKAENVNAREQSGAAKFPAHRSGPFTGALPLRSGSDDLPLRSRSTWFFRPPLSARSVPFRSLDF